MAIDLEEITIADAQDGFRRGTFTCKNLTGAFLARILALDKNGPKISSTMALSSTALEEAEALDRFYLETGNFKGPLHGITVLVKDQADTKGIVTTYSTIIAKDNVPDEDATVIKKLKDAGAVILGKTTMSEWASTWFSFSTATNGFTHNPYKLGYDVGGSSSGTGSAIAANFAILGVGEDTGGSVRCPSSFCNMVGLRPTVGLVSRAGFMPLIKTQDTPGPMARTVTDCALMLDSMVGFDPKDEWTSVAVTATEPQGGSYASDLNPDAIKKARLGVIRSLFGSDDDPDRRAVNQVMQSALSKLESAGTTLVEVVIPDLDHYLSFTPTYISCSRSDINAFLATKPHLPSDIGSFVPVEPLHPSFGFTSLLAHSYTSPEQDPDYLQRLLDRDTFQRQLTCILAANHLDAFVFPDVQIPAPKHEDSTNGRFKGIWDFPVNTLLASQARFPALSVPAGFTADEGLPVGLELVSWEFTEKKLLELGRGIEVLLQARKAPRLQ